MPFTNILQHTHYIDFYTFHSEAAIRYGSKWPGETHSQDTESYQLEEHT